MYIYISIHKVFWNISGAYKRNFLLDEMFWKFLWYASQHDSAVWRFLEAYIYNSYSQQKAKYLSILVKRR